MICIIDILETKDKKNPWKSRVRPLSDIDNQLFSFLMYTMVLSKLHQPPLSLQLLSQPGLTGITHVRCWCTMQVFVVYVTHSFLSVSCSSRGPSTMAMTIFPGTSKESLTHTGDWCFVEFDSIPWTWTKWNKIWITVYFLLCEVIASQCLDKWKLLLLFILIHTQNIWTFFVF